MGYFQFMKRGLRFVFRRVPAALRAQHAATEMRARSPFEPGTFRVAAYFADGPRNLYQLRQWYAPLQELAKHQPVVIVARSPLAARALAAESGLPVQYARCISEVEEFLEAQPVDVMLYVNQNTRNFRIMRYGQRWHVFISHGESDKKYMTSSQIKAYDYAFVAGDAARERLAKSLWRYDVTERTIAVGRPQADYFDAPYPLPEDDRTVVFYAPTWEGDRPSMAYGSVVSHGVELVRRLLHTGRHRIVYRPHPRTGVTDAEHGAASRRIISMLEEANRKDPAAGHLYDESRIIDWQMWRPDIIITDISAMLYDRLATGKPLMVTRPVSSEAEIESAGYLSDCEWLNVSDLPQIESLITLTTHDDEAKSRLAHWSHHYFGDTTQGAPTRRFIDAVETLLESSRTQRETHPAAGIL